MEYLIATILFPGFLFTAVTGMVASWIDRKITARVQWRVGPPPLQPLWDFLKLMGKETVVPAGTSKGIFLFSPLLGLAGVTLVSTLLWKSTLNPETGFAGDLIVAMYFLMLPSLAVILGGFASRNPIASLGASREMKLVMAYELPFILICLVPIIQSGGSIRVGEIIVYQGTYGNIFGSVSGVIAMIVGIMVMQAKLTLVPFDIPEAETEIMSGPFVEYSGPPLAVFKLTRMMMLITVPTLLAILFLGGLHFQGIDILWSVIKLFVLVLLVTLIRNTNPRVRIDHAMRFFWGPMTVFGVIAVVLALLGI